VNHRVFITGASGFVGRHLIQFLIRRGDSVAGTCFPEDPASCQLGDNVLLERVDIRSKDQLAPLIQDFSPHWVVHLAAISNVRVSWEKRQETVEINLLGTLNLLEVLREMIPPPRLLFVSSSDVYGILEPTDHPLREEEPIQVVNPYAFSKASAEMLVRFYSQIEGVEGIIIRAFPHTGPGQSPLFVCSDWAYQIASLERKSGGLLNIGNLEIKRDFTDVRDVVRAYVALLEKGQAGEIYNVCSGQPVSLQWILDTLISYSSSPIRIKVDPQRLRKADIPLLYGDNTKLRTTTGWQPEYPLGQTLKDLLDYWRFQLKGGSKKGFPI